MFKNIVQSKTPDKRYSFEIHNVDLAIVNGIRRVVLTDIPVAGFRGEEDPTLTILANNGPLHNEFMLHRIGLIPIHFSEEETENFNGADYEFELHVENTSQARVDVTTKDFKVRKNNVQVDPKKYFPPDNFTNDFVLITRLRPNERLHVVGRAVKSTARHHAAFSPVGLCTMTFIGDGSATIEQERNYYKNEYGDPLQIKVDIEAVAALSPRYLVGKAIAILIDKVKTFMATEAFSTPKRTDGGCEFHIEGEDDTLGNILQSLTHNHYIRDKHETSRQKTLTYVGYYCPHPLETCVVVKLCMEDHDTIDDAEYVDVMMDSCTRIVNELERIQDEWEIKA